VHAFTLEDSEDTFKVLLNCTTNLEQEEKISTSPLRASLDVTHGPTYSIRFHPFHQCQNMQHTSRGRVAIKGAQCLAVRLCSVGTNMDLT
jgi:hypothetical protein